MTTLLDIIDTAVKIGLGAIISGVSTYVVTKGKFNNDLHKAVIEDKKELIKNISIRTEHATSYLNQFIYAFYCEDFETQEGKKIIKEKAVLLSNVLNEGNHARALASMLGDSNLSNSIEEYNQGVMDVTNAVINDIETFDPHEANKLLEIIKNSSGKIHTAIEEAYADVASNA